MNPRYPVFIPTKGRYETRFTIRAMDKIGVPYKAVVEAQEVNLYVKHGVKRENILVLPHRDKGLVVTRNWIWDHAQSLGVKRFWTFDDNITGILRLNNNMRIPVADGTALFVMEDFVERYDNIPIAGMNYRFFAKRKQKIPPFYLNTRVYSNMLIETAAPFRNEGFYNDDTDLCLRVLKAGYCTVLFNAFLIWKQTTMTVKGGMTPHYLGEGRRKMAQELVDKHPDVACMSQKFGRWQHHVDYSCFAKNELRLREGVQIVDGVNEYGMLLEIDEEKEKKLRAFTLSKRIAKQQEKFFDHCVASGKSIDEALKEWRAYRDKCFEIQEIADF